jgi:hypothetical protein
MDSVAFDRHSDFHSHRMNIQGGSLKRALFLWGTENRTRDKAGACLTNGLLRRMREFVLIIVLGVAAP